MAMDPDVPFDQASPLWVGLTPTPQAETAEPLCPILYKPDFDQAMSLFRSLVAQKELSLRALALTSYLSRIASSNYTVWAYRFQLLCAEDLQPPPAEAEHDPFLPAYYPTVEARLAAELEQLDDSCREHMKQYQVWQHRKNVVIELSRRVAERLALSLVRPAARVQAAALWTQLAETELNLTSNVLSHDAKNYHTWVHRQWALVYFGGKPGAASVTEKQSKTEPDAVPTLRSLAGDTVWGGELAFADTMINTDSFNNSAWNHRYFVQFGAGLVYNSDDKVGAVYGELTYTKNKIAVFKNNQSSWAYLRGVFAQLERATSELVASEDHNKIAFNTSKGRLAPQVRDQLDLFAASLSPSDEDIESSPDADSSGNGTPGALEWRLDSIEARLTQHATRTAEAGMDPSLSPEQVDEYCARAHRLLPRLIIADPIRTRYWMDKRKLFTPSRFARPASA